MVKNICQISHYYVVNNHPDIIDKDMREEEMALQRQVLEVYIQVQQEVF